MSEFIRCDSCGDLTSFEDTTYVSNNPFCPECHTRLSYLLQTIDNND